MIMSILNRITSLVRSGGPVTYSYTYTNIVNPHTGQKIGSICGQRSDRRGYTYVLDVSPDYRWRRFPKFAVSASKSGVSDKTGSDIDSALAITQCFDLLNAHYSDVRSEFYLAQIRMRIIERAFHDGKIPPMFDPSVETE